MLCTAMGTSLYVLWKLHTLHFVLLVGFFCILVLASMITNHQYTTAKALSTKRCWLGFLAAVALLCIGCELVVVYSGAWDGAFESIHYSGELLASVTSYWNLAVFTALVVFLFFLNFVSLLIFAILWHFHLKMVWRRWRTGVFTSTMIENNNTYTDVKERAVITEALVRYFPWTMADDRDSMVRALQHIKYYMEEDKRKGKKKRAPNRSITDILGTTELRRMTMQGGEDDDETVTADRELNALQEAQRRWTTDSAASTQSTHSGTGIATYPTAEVNSRPHPQPADRELLQVPLLAS